MNTIDDIPKAILSMPLARRLGYEIKNSWIL